MTLGERIKECRTQSGLSQDKVAELVGVSRQAVTKWESGQTAPSTAHLFKLAEIFGTTVDLLIRVENVEDHSFAEQIYDRYTMDEEKKRAEQQSTMRTNILFAGAVMCGFIAMYLILQISLKTPEPSNVIGLFLGTSSKSYLWGWLLHNKLFWMTLGVSVISASFGKWHFSLTTAAMVFVGILIGEVFGPYPDGAAYRQTHYGWAIWLLIYLSSLVIGIISEKMDQNGTVTKAKQSIIWVAAVVCSCIVSVLLISFIR